MRRHESGWTERGIRQLTANAAPVKLENVQANPGGHVMDARYLSMAGMFRQCRCLRASVKISRQRKLILDYVLTGYGSLAQPEVAPC